MFNFEHTDLQRIAVAAIGAVILSTAAVSAAVGPALAVEAAPLLSAHGQTSAQARA